MFHQRSLGITGSRFAVGLAEICMASREFRPTFKGGTRRLSSSSSFVVAFEIDLEKTIEFDYLASGHQFFLLTPEIAMVAVVFSIRASRSERQSSASRSFHT